MILCICMTACIKKEKTPLQTGYYYWKMGNTDSLEINQLNDLQLPFIYVKIADVGYSSEISAAKPIAKLEDIPDISEKSELIPVIYIKNEVFEQTDTTQLNVLAQNVSKYFSQWTFYSPATVKELQIDCDWTSKTKESYFKFLRALKAENPHTTISVTLRLYPYKYRTMMGVPPADKVLLMCYNMGQIKEFKEKNSIITTSTLQSYLVSKPYPLPLDIALPAFGWYVWFRNEQFRGIVYEKDLQKYKPKLKHQKNNLWMMQEDYSNYEAYYRYGDIFRDEFPDTKTLEKAVKILRKNFPQSNRIVLFHWDQSHQERYTDLVQSLKNGNL